MDPVVTMQGNLVADPVQRVTASGVIVTRFRIAASSRRQDKQTGEWVDGDPNFINVSCWRHLASNVQASLKKGDSVVVHGRLIYREYDDKQQVHRREHEIDAIAVGPDLTRAAADIRRAPRPTPSEAAPAEPVPTGPVAAAAGPWGETPVASAESAA